MRVQAEAKLILVEIPDTIPEIVARFQKTRREWRSFARHHAQEERQTFLRRIAIAQAEAEPNPKITTNKNLKQLQTQEEQRHTSRNIKFVLGGISSGGVTSVQYKNLTGTIVEAKSREDMESAIIHSNEKILRQAHGTPFMHPPLAREVG
jgi:hypothetical protein